MNGLTTTDILRLTDDTPTATPHCICRNITCEGYNPKLISLKA